MDAVFLLPRFSKLPGSWVQAAQVPQPQIRVPSNLFVRQGRENLKISEMNLKLILTPPFPIFPRNFGLHLVRGHSPSLAAKAPFWVVEVMDVLWLIVNYGFIMISSSDRMAISMIQGGKLWGCWCELMLAYVSCYNVDSLTFFDLFCAQLLSSDHQPYTLFWHSFWMFLTYHLEVFMAYILTFYLAFSLAWALPDLNRERQISVALRSGARSWSPAGGEERRGEARRGEERK